RSTTSGPVCALSSGCRTGRKGLGLVEVRHVSEVPSEVPGRPRPPRVSGKFAAAGLAIGFVLSAALVPMALHLPVWIDAEIVLTIWWAVWFAVLSRFLYTGTRVTDDHRWSSPRAWVKSDAVSSDVTQGCIWLPIESEGCLIALALVALVFAAWFLIEVAI